jgi:hypothetical protein
VVLLIISISTLLFFRIPEIKYFKGIYFNETLQYSLIALAGLICVLILKPPTLSYFGLPRVRGLGTLFIFIAIAVAAFDMSAGYDIKQPLRVKIAGVITIFSIGLAEEMIMHINVYLPDWSAWDAYWHVMMATGFGLLTCAIFIATRSYWVVVAFHALSDWTVVFDKKNTYGGEDYSPGILEGLSWGVESFAIEYGLLGLLLLFILRGRWPKWIIRLAIRWKLVEQAQEFKPSKSRWFRKETLAGLLTRSRK